MTCKRMGILGGTFDPIHTGHLHMVEAIFSQLELEQIIFIPAYVAPHKQGLDFAPAADRYTMTQLAVQGFSHFTVSDMELKRTGVSYTVDTLRELHEIYPKHELFFIIGADSVEQLHTWTSIYEMFELATFVGAGRPGYDGVLEKVEAQLGKQAMEHIKLLDTPKYDISSTEIRRRIREGKTLDGFVPKVVEKYIYEHGLYQKHE